MDSTLTVVLVCLGFYAAGIWAIVSAGAVRRRCTATAIAVIADIQVSHGPSDDHGHSELHYTPILRYYDTTGRVVETRHRTWSTNPRQYAVGQTFQLHFNPAKPTEFYTGQTSRNRVVLGVVLLLLGTMLLVFGVMN